MIVSNGGKEDRVQFEDVLDTTTSFLKLESQRKTDQFKNIHPVDFEIKVMEILEKSSRGSSFEGSFEHISGQRFPDITSQKYGYGVEVKKTISNHWTTIGNSIMEGNRVNNIKKVYLLFGKLAKPMDFRYRLYEDCLAEVKITHSPRYLIDMDVTQSNTIFSKVGKSYDEIRKLENPFQPIKTYLRQILREKGEEVWWVDENEESGGEAHVRLWANLSRDDKKLYQSKMMGLFPEVFGNSQTKYSRSTSWLVSRYGIVSHALRDTFTSGRNVCLTVDGEKYERVSSIFSRLQQNIPRIKSEIKMFTSDEIGNYWGENIKQTNRLELWINKVVTQSESYLNANNMCLPVEKLIREKI